MYPKHLRYVCTRGVVLPGGRVWRAGHIVVAKEGNESKWIIHPQTLGGSFSSVSKPIFASKYAFCSIFRDLQDLQTFAPLQIQNFRDFSIFRKICNFFEIFCKILRNFVIFRSDFHGNLLEFHRISAILILQLQNFRKLVKIQKKIQKKFKKNAYCRLAGCFQNDPSPPSSHISIH